MRKTLRLLGCIDEDIADAKKMVQGLKKEDMRGDIKYELDMIYNLINIASENIEKANGYLARIYNDGNDGEVQLP